MKVGTKLSIAGLALAISASAQDAPSLNDTLQWMQNTLDAGAGSLYVSKGNDGEVEKREVTMPDAKSCQIGFQYQTGPLEKGSFGVITKPTYKLVEKLNFRDIDPNAIAVGKPTKNGKPADMMGPYVMFSATTRDNAKSISNVVSLYPEPVTEEPFTSDTLLFALPYPYADRFTKAFKHAVTLCGGKPSSF